MKVAVDWWGRTYVDGPHAHTPFELLPRHSLPYFYVRHEFLLLPSLPPWTKDALDEAFVSAVLPKRLSNSICVSDEAAARWRKRNLSVSSFSHLVQTEQRSDNLRGRPNMRPGLKAAYLAMYPNGENLSWKELHASLQEAVDHAFGIDTLKRAVGELRGKQE